MFGMGQETRLISRAAEEISRLQTPRVKIPIWVRNSQRTRTASSTGTNTKSHHQSLLKVYKGHLPGQKQLTTNMWIEIKLGQEDKHQEQGPH